MNRRYFTNILTGRRSGYKVQRNQLSNDSSNSANFLHILIAVGILLSLGLIDIWGLEMDRKAYIRFGDSQSCWEYTSNEQIGFILNLISHSTGRKTGLLM